MQLVREDRGMTRSGVECVALVVGLAVAVGLYVWHGGHYPLPVDLAVVAVAGLVAYISARELGLWTLFRAQDRKAGGTIRG